MRICRRRGSALICALLLTVVFLMMGEAILATRSRGYSESAGALTSAQARQLARAGVEDARLKLSKDVDFPPRLANRKTYAYSDTVFDPTTQRPIGTYNVSVDVSWRSVGPTPVDSGKYYKYPIATVLVTSTGSVIGDNQKVSATDTVTAQIDLSPKRRDADVSNDTTQPSGKLYDSSAGAFYTNPNYNQYLRYEDSMNY